MNFSEPKLVAKYGSWVRVQVAFYDFIFQHGIGLCATHFNQVVSSEALSTGFGDCSPTYEYAVRRIQLSFKTPEAAWKAFCTAERMK